jgi:probable F420-dependent oxidoreductase
VDRRRAARHPCETAPGRIVAGIGGAHGPRHIPRLAAYLDELDELGIGRDRRVLAALGPRKLELARDRTAGAITLMVTPEHTARIREALGPDAVLVVQHFVAVDENPVTARAALREPLEFLSGLPGDRANFLRMGFTDDDVTDLSDRLVDGVTAWGSAETVTARLREHLDAGADQVVIDETAFGRGAGAGVIAAAR